MSACEGCWSQASMHAAMFGGVAADHYRRFLAENEGIHARNSTTGGAAPTTTESKEDAT